MVYWNPLNCESGLPPNPRAGREFVCAASPESRRGGVSAHLFTGAIHLFNAVNYDVLKPFVEDVDIPLFAAVQLLSMSVLFLGGYAMLHRMILRTLTAEHAFLILIAAGTLGTVTITSAETRFGLLATAVFSWLSVELLVQRLDRTERISLLFGLALFLLATSLLSIYVLSLSGGVAP